MGTNDECFVQLVGGLGNQLFQIATAYAHAKRNGYTLKVSATVASAAHGTYYDSFLHSIKPYLGNTTGGLRWREPHFHYAPIPPPARQLNGYFQSSKYFADVSGEIRELFTPAPAVVATVGAKYADLLIDPAAWTVVHIRRGDYLRHTNFHGILTEDYYRRAVATAPTGRLLVFSDDIEWCRSRPWLTAATFVDEPDAAVSLHLMSQFENYIISNSTFSWWAVWLGREAKTVLAPAKWFGPAGPQDYEDIYEPVWTRLEV
jgi:hypothetical protein